MVHPALSLSGSRGSCVRGALLTSAESSRGREAIPGRPARAGKATPVRAVLSSERRICRRMAPWGGFDLRFGAHGSIRARAFPGAAPHAGKRRRGGGGRESFLFRGALGAIFFQAALAARLLHGLEAALLLRLVAYERIHVTAEFHRHGRGEQVEALTEYVGEIP